MKNYKVYLITNTAKLTNNLYVGQTSKSIEQRFKEHIDASMHINEELEHQKNIYALHHAIHKYGENAFKIELLEDNICEEDIDQREKYYINLYDSYLHGYNETLGGQGVHGYSHTAETKEKLSNRSKIAWEQLRNDPEKLAERNKKISDKQKGVKKSDEQRRKLSIAASKRVGEKNSFYGKTHTDDVKQKIRETQSIPVIVLSKDGVLLNEFESANVAMKWLNEQCITKNTNASLIIRCCKKKCNFAYGFIWRYKVEE